MNKYLGVKLIEAKQMTRGDYNKFKGWTIPENENPDDKGYLVKYSDDYISWSPKQVFEEAYRPTNGLNFGLAVEGLKKGLKVAREGWNGKRMYVIYQKGYPAGVPANKNMAETGEVQEFELIKINPWLQIKCADGTYSTWVPSINDCLAEDWQIVE